MFCPNCGKGEQAPDSYCRSCGEYLTDFTARFALIDKLLGGVSPRAQVNINIALNTLTGLASSLLLGFLNGYYDSLRAKTGEGTPRIIYYVYVFLALVLVWQLFGLIVNRRLKKKLDGEKRKKSKTLPAAAPADEHDAVAPPTTPKSLETGKIDPIPPESVTQQTTKRLDKIPRK
ncbi:MAG TPA: hypothetical protein VF297_08925 [Pyrinomonadaceae bacterium]